MGIKRRLGKVVFMTALFAWASASQAYQCSGTVQVTLAPQGLVTINGVGGLSWVYLCYVNQTWNGVDGDSCKAILSSLLTAQATGKDVQLWFNDSLTCTTHPAWSQLTGWYYGPWVIG